MLRIALSLGAALVLLVGAARPGHALGSFVEFESGHTRPLALSPDGTKLFAVNTPDNRLEIFAIDGSGNLTAAGSVPVGMEPVAVAARTNTEVWVVNHLSDSVSIVSLATSPPRVVNTLLVGDEPRDILFAGTAGNLAFITTAHRGQNSGVPFSDFLAEGIGRADVWVFDATDLGTALGGTPATVVELFGDTPRALARNADGSRVYAAVFQSGNRTTAVNEALVCDGGAGAASCNISGNVAPGGLTAPNPLNCAGQQQPETGIIVKYNGTQWVDEAGRNWSNMVKLELPDQDVFAIDANAVDGNGDPQPVATGTPWAGVGTILFNMAVNPVSGKIYVSNTEAKNERRFEGPGTCSTTVQGRLHQARITVLDGASVNPRHLNKHIDYSVRPAPLTTKQNSLATPTDLVVTPDGLTLYVAAFGSSKIGFFSTAQLENNTFTPDASSHIPVTGGGPSGLVLRGNRLYAFTRFDNGISTIDTGSQSEVGHLTLFNPEPANIVAGRPVLYDATTTSSNGEASCSSCHVFGDFDSLAWDLGNPDDAEATSPIPQRIAFGDKDFFPMKGPMTTQSLRGMAHHGAMHWRGDRSNGFFGTDAFDEELSFNNFIVAFPGLLGNAGQIAVADMQKFTDFILDVNYPPNPIRALTNLPAGNQGAGQTLYNGAVTDTLFNCNGCHTLDASQGFFGGDGFATFENETQAFKVAHLRNAYQKIGMFGMAANSFVTTTEPTTNQGPQVRGFGFLHDGSIPTVHRFLGANVFSTSDAQERNLEEFILAFPSTLAPIVGQQITRTSTNGGTVDGRIDRLVQQADTPFTLVGHPGANECDLIVKGTIAGLSRGWLFDPATNNFVPDKAAEPVISDAALRAHANTPGQELTYTCVPPGSGIRMGIDRDLDGFRDGDEAVSTTTTTSTSSTSSSSTSTSSTTSTSSSTTTSTSLGGGSTTSTSTSTSSSSTTSTSVTPSSSTTTSSSTSSSSNTSSSSTTSSSTSSTTSTTLDGIAVSATKLIVVDRTTLAGSAKVAFVTKDTLVTKGSGLDPAQISVAFDLWYDNGATAGTFTLPAGLSDGTSGWLTNRPTVAKFVNRTAPTGPTSAKIGVIKPGKLLKLVGKSLGDTPLDVLGAGDPGANGVRTVFAITNGGSTFRHCSHFTSCVFKPIGAGTGAKLVCRPGAPTACP